MSKPTIVVWGPQGSGKTQNANAIRDFFGLDRILDNFDGKQGFIGESNTPTPVNENGDLCLTESNLIVNGFALVYIEAAKDLLGDNWITP